MTSSSKKGILGLALVLTLAAGGAGFMMFNQEHTNLSETIADYTLTASELARIFEEDEAAAMEEYGGKNIQVSGILQEMNETEGGGRLLVLAGETELFGINCSFLAEEKGGFEAIAPGTEMVVQGLCSGSTNLGGIGGVDLSRCILPQ